MLLLQLLRFTGISLLLCHALMFLILLLLEFQPLLILLRG